MPSSPIPGVAPRMLHTLLANYFQQPVLPNGRRRRPLMIESPPAMGKTDIVHQAAQSLALTCVDLRLIQHETVDVTGAIGVNQATKTADWFPFESLFPTDPDWEGVIFIDEVSQLPADMQKVLMGVLDREGVAGRRIPAGARFVMAGNRQQDRAGSSRLLTPIESRTLRVELLFSMEDWQVWAAKNGIDQVVMSYATFVGAHEFIPDFNPADQIHASPRTWAAVSDELQARPNADPSAENAEIRTVIQSLVGPGPVAQFMAFRQHFALLHGVVDQVFDSPDSGHFDGLETSALHALIGAVASRMKERNGSLDAKKMRNVMLFGERCLSMTLNTIMFIHCNRSGGKQWQAAQHDWLKDHPDFADAITAAMRISA